MSRFLQKVVGDGTKSEPTVTSSQLRELADEFDRLEELLGREMPTASPQERREELRKLLMENCREYGKLRVIELLT